MKALPNMIVLAALAAASFSAVAQVQRTFVASTGVDNPACSLTSPCRGFTAAVAVTNAGGEVIVLDSAGYGTVSIDKSAFIMAPEGVYAGVTVFSGTGISVSGPSVRVTLRGLSVNGQGGVVGIRFAAGSIFCDSLVWSRALLPTCGRSCQRLKPWVLNRSKLAGWRSRSLSVNSKCWIISPTGCPILKSPARLYLSPNTLKAHTQNIFLKLEVHNRYQAVRKAKELGLIK